MRRFVINVLLILVFCLNIIVTSADSIYSSDKDEVFTELKIKGTRLYSESETVTRSDAIYFLMQAIGFAEEFDQGERFKPSDWSLEEFHNLTIAEEQLLWQDIYNACKFQRGIAWVFYAIENGITFGEDERYDETEDIKYVSFNFTRDITIKEALALMVRCVKKSDDANLEETYEEAKILGLIVEGDSFYTEGDAPIYAADFFAILDRFLHMPCYKYFVFGTFRVYEEQEMTYYENRKRMLYYIE